MALCPHCRNALPETGTRHCPNCGGDVDLPSAATSSQSDGAPPPLTPEAVGRGAPPPGGGGHGAPPAGGIPWDDRERLGLANALVETTKQVLTRPTDFYRAMPRTGGIGGPLLYAVIIGWIGIVAAGFYSALFNSLVGSSMATFGSDPALAEAVGFAQSWGGFLVQLIFGGVMVAIGVFIASGIYHVMLMILGGARHGFEATFRVVCFAEATYLFMLLPFCGSVIAPVWGIVLAVIGLTQAHQIGGGKAAAAVLLPLVIFCCCCVGLALLFASTLGAVLSQVQ
ncbi:MAG: YIP1 family protein [Acidobacteria bacterium]|nr:YIP1 family protein [Acidobacteriota bacterium]